MSSTTTDAPYWVQLCGSLAPVASIVVCMSPIPTIQEIIRSRKVGSLPLLPYTTMILNSMLWFAYGLLQHEIKIWSCNGTGLVLGIYYFVYYIKYYSPTATTSSSATHHHNTLPGTIQQHVQAILGTLVFAILCIIANTAWLIGKVGMIFCVGLFASPLSVVRIVIATQSARCIPLPFTLASLINCFLWTAFGWKQANDANLYIPNFLGLLLSLTQLGLKLRFDTREHLLEELTASRRGAVDGKDDAMMLPLTKAPLSAPPT